MVQVSRIVRLFVSSAVEIYYGLKVMEGTNVYSWEGLDSKENGVSSLDLHALPYVVVTAC